MKILGIETSCDETAAAVIETDQHDQISVRSNVVSSQVKLHAKFGGVVPNLAAREHVKNIQHVFKQALKEAKIKNFASDIDAIAVTYGPGLAPALLVGITFARTLAWKYSKPLIGVNHMDGHIHSNWLQPIRVVKSRKFKVKSENELFPALNLIVSGGHTELVLMKDHGKYTIIGETLDDAVGEAFDKVARLLGLGYPGGPIVSTRAGKFKVESGKFKVTFPRPMLHSKDFDFSYSGLKTAVLYKVRELKETRIKITGKIIDQICYEFQKAAIEVLVEKTFKAAKKYKVQSILLSGGVSANKLLRSELSKRSSEEGIRYLQPAMEYTGDNAAMIAAAGYFQFLKKSKSSWKNVEMDATLTL